MVNRKCPAYYWLFYIANGLAFCCLLWLASSPEPLGEVMDLLGGSGDTALALHPASVCKTQSLEKSLVFSICLGDYSVFMSVANNWAKGNRRSVSRPMLSPGQGFGRQYEAGTGSKTEAEGL